MALRRAVLALCLFGVALSSEEEDCVANEEESSVLLQQAARDSLQQVKQHETSSLAQQRGEYKFDLKLKAGPGIEITGPAFDTENGAEYGCGAGNRKCQCLYGPDGFQMQGYGTDGTWTGLEFTCKDIKFSMPQHDPAECTCSFKAMINFWGKGRSFTAQCDPKQCFTWSDSGGPGKVHDLFDRFDNPNGGGDISATSWEFNIQANAMGTAKPKKPTEVLGGWKPISSGAATEITQSLTWSNTKTKAKANEISEALTVGTKYTYSQKMGISVPEVGSAEQGMSVEVSMSSTTAWKQTITETESNTQGGTQTLNCKPQDCSGGTSYQWQTSVNTMSTWGALFQSCIFVCMPNQGELPKCPYGTCCTGDLTNQCTKCSVKWCDEKDSECPFHDPSFTPGCD